MQRDGNRLGDVFHLLGIMHRLLLIDSTISAALETRWEKMEQPLFVLGYAAQPKYATKLRLLIKQLPSSSLFTISKLARMSHLYYEKYIGPDPQKKIIEELCTWLWYDDATVDGLPIFNSEAKYWKFMGDQLPLWSSLSLFLMAVVVQAATCERLFKEWARFHTASRNRMSLATTEKLVQVKKHQLRRREASGEPEGVGCPVAGANRVMLPDELPRLRSDVPPPVAIEESDDESSNDNVDGREGRWDHLDVSPQSIITKWKEALDSVQEDDDEEIELESGQVHQQPADSDSSRADPVQRCPFPDWNDPTYPQEVINKLPVTNPRRHKESLSTWFCNSVDLQ